MVQVRARGVLASSILLGGCVARPELHGPMPVRNQHPAQLTVLHLPVRGARTLPRGQIAAHADAAYSNLFLAGGSAGTNWVMDGEYLRAAASLRTGIGAGVEFGIELPFAHTTGGFLDGFVIGYHDALGLPDQGREDSPREAFEVGAQRDGESVWAMTREGFTLLDVPLTLAWQVADPDHGLGVVLQGGIELPTGDGTHGYGNGELDAGLGVAVEQQALGVGFHGHLQHTFAGTPRQSRANGFAFADVTAWGLGVELPVDPGVSVLVQVAGETSTLRDLRIPVVTRQHLILWVGGRIRIDRDWQLELGLGEDLQGLVSPDFTAWFGLAWTPAATMGR